MERRTRAYGPSCLLMMPGRLVVRYSGVPGRKVFASHALCHAVVLRTINRKNFEGDSACLLSVSDEHPDFIRNLIIGWRCAVATPSGELIFASDAWYGLRLWC